MERFAALMRDYAAHRQGSAVLDALIRIEESQWRPESILVVPVFLALMLDGAPDLGPLLVDQVRQRACPVQMEVAAQALNYCHLPDRARLMERLVGERAAGQMEMAGADFSTFQPSHPVHVDMLWACFFATGDDHYVHALIGLLDGWLPPVRLADLVARARQDAALQPQAMAGLLAQAAEAGLTAQAPHFPMVIQALTHAAQRQDGLASACAARVLAALA